MRAAHQADVVDELERPSVLNSLGFAPVGPSEKPPDTVKAVKPGSGVAMFAHAEALRDRRTARSPC